MSITMKRAVMAAFGLLAAAALWPLMLALNAGRAVFHSYLLFTIIQGASLGLVFGAFFGSLEGIVVSSRPKALAGLLFGAGFGAFAGAVGALAGQLFLFWAGSGLWRSASRRDGIGLAVAAGLGWAVAGLLLGLTEGLRARSGRKLAAGLLGGLTGGLLGGAALSAASYRFPDRPLALLAGLAAFGLALGLAYAAFENRFSAGCLMVLNGPLKGKQYPVVNRVTRIGGAPGCDLVLKGYPEVEALHAVLSLEGGRVFVRAAAPRGAAGRATVAAGTTKGQAKEAATRDAGPALLVNDEPPGERALRPDDVLAVGKAKLIYGFFS